MPDKETFVTGLARGLSVLRAFRSGKPEMTITEVADAADLSPAAVRRSLLTFVQLGYMRQRDGRFLLRPRVLELGAAFLESMSVVDLVEPYLEELRDTTGDGISLTILDGGDIIHIIYIPAKRILREVNHAGARTPAYLVPTGRVLLSHLPDSELEQYLATVTLVPRTSKTVSNVDTLRTVLVRIKSQGYAVVTGELEVGLTAIGVPVFDTADRAVAGLGLATLSAVASPEEMASSRLKQLVEAAAQISALIKRSPVLEAALQP